MAKKDDLFLISPELQGYLGMSLSRGTRKQIQSAFIQAAIEREFVNPDTHQYEIYKVPLLYARFGEREVAPKEIFKKLRQNFLQKL